MRQGALDVKVTLSRAEVVRSLAWDAVHTGQRAMWAARLVSLVLFAAFGVQGFLAMAATGADVRAAGVVLPFVALAWFLAPLLRGSAFGHDVLLTGKGRVTFHAKGVEVRSPWTEMSFTWAALERVHATALGLRLVFARGSLLLPSRLFADVGDIERVLTWVAEAQSARFEAARGYRVSAARSSQRHDPTLDAPAREWEPPVGSVASAVSFPTSRDLFLGALRAQGLFWVLPVGLLGIAGFCAAAASAFTEEQVVPFGRIAVLIALVALSSLAFDVLSAWRFARDPGVRERHDGVLVAVGASGLYVRTRDRESRESWELVAHARETRRSFILVAREIHVVPLAAFADAREADAFAECLTRHLPEPRRQLRARKVRRAA